MSLRPNTGASSTSHRKKVYKNTGVDFEESRRRRQDDAIQIRKSRRQENLFKKRKEEDDTSSPCPINPNPDLVVFKIQRIPILTQELFSNDPAAQQPLRFVIYYQRVLIDSGALPCLKLLLSQSDKDVLKHACWIISNITGGNRAQIQAEFEIKKEVAWAISNCAYGTREQIRMTFVLFGLYYILSDDEGNVYAEKVGACG